MEIRFLSANEFKINEAQEIMSNYKIDIVAFKEKIDEIQTTDANKLVRDKTMKAFQKVGRPIFVEHTGLYLEYINDLPGGLTQIFWDNLKADKFTNLFGNTKAVARTIVGFCDGMRFYFFEGEISGTIAKTPIGNRDFQWDCVFIPDGYDKTFAELGVIKNEISMRRAALDKFAIYLTGGK